MHEVVLFLTLRCCDTVDLKKKETIETNISAEGYCKPFTTTKERIFEKSAIKSVCVLDVIHCEILKFEEKTKSVSKFKSKKIRGIFH